MKGNNGDKGSNSGERAPLLRGRDASVVQIRSDDTHTLHRQVSRDKHKKEPAPKKDHMRNSSNMTQLSGGAFTNLSGELTKYDDERKKRSRNRHLKVKILIATCYLLVFVYTLIILIGPLVLSFQEESEWCPIYSNDSETLKKSSSSSPIFHWDVPIQDRQYDNPDFDQNPCHYVRLPQLCWLTLVECDMSRRMLVSVILGGAIGYERRTSDRPAGIRTMGLVSLGACFFTISSIMAFRSSTMGWDASRVTAALPSGVGFLGAALIWKGSIGSGDEEVHQVHGLTTAASLWLSAAIGVGAGGALYFVSVYSTVLILLVLRFGPTFYMQEDSESVVEEQEQQEMEDNSEAAGRNVVTQRWLNAAQTQQQDSSTFERQESTLTDRSEQKVTFVHAGFPESLTSEDTQPPLPTRLSMASLRTTPSARSVGAAESRSERKRQRQSRYDPPTFHS